MSVQQGVLRGGGPYPQTFFVPDRDGWTMAMDLTVRQADVRGEFSLFDPLVES